MDSFTHIVLGGAIGQAFFGRRLGKWAFVIGAVAATVPDLDVFIHTGNAVNDHLIHRYFSHALLLAPVLAGITTAGFMLRKSLRPHALLIYLLCLIAVFSHIFLDACTSYGTLLLWPFAEQRAALDLVAVVDVFFTGILVAGVIVAWRRKSALAARVALVAALAYLGLAAVQHERALETQQQLIARRGQLDASNPRAIPQLGTTLNFRTLYLSGGKIFVDAVRVPPLGAGRCARGVRSSRWWSRTCSRSRHPTALCGISTAWNGSPTASSRGPRKTRRCSRTCVTPPRPTASIRSGGCNWRGRPRRSGTISWGGGTFRGCGRNSSGRTGTRRWGQRFRDFGAPQ